MACTMPHPTLRTLMLALLALICIHLVQLTSSESLSSISTIKGSLNDRDSRPSTFQSEEYSFPRYGHPFSPPPPFPMRSVDSTPLISLISLVPIPYHMHQALSNPSLSIISSSSPTPVFATSFEIVEAENDPDIHGGSAPYSHTPPPPSLLSTRRTSSEALGSAVSLVLSTEDNATAAARICAALSAAIPPLNYVDISSNTTGPWELPDCVYGYPKILNLFTRFMIIRGNATYPDPLERLGKSCMFSYQLVIFGGSLLLDTGARYVPDWEKIFESLPTLPYLSLRLLGLTGGLPKVLGPAMRSFTISENQLSGTIPSTLFSSLPGNAIQTFLFSGNNNRFTGTIPEPFFGTTAFPLLTSLNIAFRIVDLSGNIPSMIPAYAPNLQTYILQLNQNTKLTGTISPALMSDWLNLNINATTSPNPKLVMQFSPGFLSGRLDFPDAPTNRSVNASLPTIQVSAAANKLTGVTFGNNSASYLNILELSNNVNLAGQLTQLIASTSSNLTSLKASGTLLDGNLPELAGTPVGDSLNTLILSSTKIEFCAPSNRSEWVLPAGTCQLLITTADDCKSLYPNCTTSSICPLAAKPTTGTFECINHTWTSTTTVTVPQLVIPAATVITTTVVIGNVSSTTVAFTGLGNTLEVRGCATNLSRITVTLEPEDLDRIGSTILRQVLLSSNGSGIGCTNLSTIAVTSTVAGSTCKSLETESMAQGNQLIALFSVSSSSCKGKSKTWWIILAAVLGGVVVIAVITLVLVFTLNEKARLWIRPHAGKSAAKSHKG